MRRRENELAVETLCWPAGKAANNWGTRKLLRIAKRKSHSWGSPSYFCVGVGDDYGHGVWLEHNQVTPLTPLELLALHGDDEEVDQK
jgi:hypothetical protein